MNQTDNTTTPDAAHVPPAADNTHAADAGAAPGGAAEAQAAAPSLE
jgi:hypothetical protein